MCYYSSLNKDKIAYRLSHSQTFPPTPFNKSAQDPTFFQNISSVIPSSLSQIKKTITRTLYSASVAENQHWATLNSPSAPWHRSATKYQPLSIPSSMLRNRAVILHLLRLRYRMVTPLPYLLLCSILDNIYKELFEINNLSDYSLSVPAAIHTFPRDNSFLIFFIYQFIIFIYTYFLFMWHEA